MKHITCGVSFRYDAEKKELVSPSGHGFSKSLEAFLAEHPEWACYRTYKWNRASVRFYNTGLRRDRHVIVTSDVAPGWWIYIRMAPGDVMDFIEHFQTYAEKVHEMESLREAVKALPTNPWLR